MPPLSYQSIKDEDVILITLRVFHHDVEEGIQSVLEELDKRRTVAFRKRTDSPQISSLCVLPREQEHTPSMCHIPEPGVQSSFMHKLQDLEWHDLTAVAQIHVL